MSGLNGLPTEIQNALRDALTKRGISEDNPRVNIFAIPLGEQEASGQDSKEGTGEHVDCTAEDCGFELAKELARDHKLTVSDDKLFEIGVHMISTAKIANELREIDRSLFMLCKLLAKKFDQEALSSNQ